MFAISDIFILLYYMDTLLLYFIISVKWNFVSYLILIHPNILFE